LIKLGYLFLQLIPMIEWAKPLEPLFPFSPKIAKKMVGEATKGLRFAPSSQKAGRPFAIFCYERSAKVVEMLLEPSKNTMFRDDWVLSVFWFSFIQRLSHLNVSYS